MKRMLATGSIAALAMVGFSATASADPAQAGCFGQVHKYVNTVGYAGADNVGQLIGAVGGGQEKNTAARGLVAGGFCG